MTTPFQIIAIAGLTATLAACVAFAATGKKPDKPISFVGYRQWHLVNPKPYFVSEHFSTLCMLPQATVAATMGGPPHGNRYISVYVNDAAVSAIAARTPIKFAAGSTIVKEKRVKPNGPVELLTVMVKGAPGSNPATGDWKYYVTDTTGAKVTEAVDKPATDFTRFQTCQYCHETRKKDDYVFRTYLPSASKQTALK